MKFMFKKMMMVLAVLLVCLLAISAVSAQTDAAGTDSSAISIDSTDETALGSSETDELQNDNEPSSVDAGSGKLEMGEGEVLGKDINVTGDSFADIENAINESEDGDIIYLQGGYFTGNGNQIIINKNITIIGGFESGDGIYATLDAQKLSRIFQINAPVTLQGIKFINGSSDDGGAIYVNGGGTLIDCIFTNNHAANNGGAVYWNTADVSITDCTFENNYADYGAGGANYFCDYITDVDLSGNFINNTASSGGANYFYEEVTDLVLSGNFTDNTAGENGGVNYFNKDVTNIDLSGNFADNAAEEYGGANYFNSAITNISLSGNFTGNRALNKKGGVNHFERNVTNITVSGDFIGNYAHVDGGVNYFYEDTYVTNLALSGNFINNTAGEYGGVNCIDSDEVTNVTMSGNFINNTAKEYSGGVNYFYGDLTNVTMSGNFINNSAQDFNGGVNYFADVVINITLSGNFTNNSAQHYYGGVNYFAGVVFNITLSGNFTNNHAGQDGGANCFSDDVINVTVSGNFINNTAGQDGGANEFSDNVYGASLSGNFINNRAGRYGGANDFYSLITNVTLSGNFINNTAGKYGGANYFGNGVTDVSLSGNFTENSAEEVDGGANCFREDVTNVVLSGNFINNTAGRDGGANEFVGNVADVNLTGNFINNIAKRAGGANDFYGEVANCNFTGNFINNTAEESGSAYNFWNAFGTVITNVTLTGNYINNTGKSVIYIGNSDPGNVIRDSIFINNGPINVEYDTVDAFDNWFGNNVTDYDVEPDAGIDLVNWLFLNGTADPNPVSAADTSNIIFKLSRYNETGVSDYDNSRLLPITLDVTSTSGSVNPNQTGLDESITYSPNSSGTGSVTASFENVVCTIEMENQIADPELEANFEDNITYGEDAVLLIKINENATGYVEVYNIDDAENPVLIANITVEEALKGINITGLNAGNHSFNISYTGDERFLESESNATLSVEKADVILTAEKIEMYVSDGSKLKVVLTDSNGKPLSNRGIKVNIAGKTYTIKTNASGVAVLPINLKAGSYTVSVWFNGDSNLNPSENVSTSVEVYVKSRITGNNDLVKKAGGPEPFKVRALDKYGKPVKANAKVQMTVAGKTYTVFTDANGYASLPINLKAGTYKITTVYGGTTVTNTITVKK